MHRATTEVPAWWFWGTCARLCSIRTLALSRRHPPFSAASVNTLCLLRGPEVTEVWRPQGPDAPLGSLPHTLPLRGLGVPVGSLETVVTGGLGLPLGGVGNSQETPGPVTISRGAGGRWFWAARGGTLEGGAPTKNKGDPLGGTSWAERTCKGEDGVCPGSSRDSEDTGAWGSRPHPRLHVQGWGSPERPRAGGGAKQEPCPHQWWHRWREDSGEVLDPPGALRHTDVTLGPVLGEWMPVREARSQAPLTGPVITPVGLQGRAWEAQARLVAHLVHRKPPAACVLAICPRPTLACVVAGVESGGRPESYPPGLKPGDNKGTLSQEWVVAESGACAELGGLWTTAHHSRPTTHCPRRRACSS